MTDNPPPSWDEQVDEFAREFAQGLRECDIKEYAAELRAHPLGDVGTALMELDAMAHSDPVEDFYRRVRFVAERDPVEAGAYKRAIQAVISEHRNGVEKCWRDRNASIVSEGETRRRTVQALRDARSESTS